MIVTDQMRLALAALRLTGVTFYVVEERPLACGCIAQSGWNTETCEPACGLQSCSKYHATWFQNVVMAGWESEETLERFGDLPLLDSLEQQMLSAPQSWLSAPQGWLGEDP